MAPTNVDVLPTYNPPAIAAPPLTINAPSVVELAEVAFVIVILLFVLAPLFVTVCSVLVFQTVTVPVLLLIAVSVPAVNVCTPKLTIVNAVDVPVEIKLVIPM